ncbi:porin [Sulfitobacter donghicola]|uniref:Porin n=1 Tax=Sulfitobacter donghicola DSW-25 = KCTC 12864 = JCM 14565 TaxID=1300350 RepID=A0A073IKY4_9RHOB|nr:porin [Sulfitobacter donghicola]KEJ90429.1 porin [Sulfitobacter donghicola DSW-25 = KCTC 12864 = JCM 14565]KIN67659.1 Outer membrane porin [Sulfitobacter donghicola DSW-25 = KCTC 12864 = JCM 14565]
MKKVLFATTALVATASVAAADVSFSGYGRFGIVYNSDDGTGDSSTDLTSRFRLQIDATAESDAGVTFGARVRLEGEERDAANGNRPQFNGVRYFARSGGLEIGVGNIFGALEFMPGMYPIDIGLTGHNYDYTAYNFRGDAYSSGGLGDGGDNGVEVLYSAGDFSLHVSASDTDDRIAAHVAYTWNGWTFALGAQDSDNAADTEFAASVGGSFGIADVTLAYADNGTAGDHIVLAGRVDVGAATNIEAYVADADQWADTSFGIDFNHDMGGGTSLRGGVSTGGSLGDETMVDLGVRFNF